MEYEKRKISELIPYENNPRINDEAVADVVESIKQCSYIAPIIIDENNVLLAGHTRLKALKRLHYSECDVIVVRDLSEDQKKKFRLYDNKASEFSKWDVKKLMKELSDVDFGDYDFGQPVKEPEAEEVSGPIVKTCPCCGEVFEV